DGAVVYTVPDAASCRSIWIFAAAFRDDSAQYPELSSSNGRMSLNVKFPEPAPDVSTTAENDGSTDGSARRPCAACPLYLFTKYSPYPSRFRIGCPRGSRSSSVWITFHGASAAATVAAVLVPPDA